MTEAARALTKKLIGDLTADPSLFCDGDFVRSFPVIGSESFDIAVDYDRHPAYAGLTPTDLNVEVLLPQIIKTLGKVYLSEFNGRLSHGLDDDSPLARMRRDGATGLRADPDLKAAIIRKVQPQIASVRAQRVKVAPTGRGNVNSSAMLGKLKAGSNEIMAALENILAVSGTLEVAAGYMGRPVALIEAVIMIKDETDTNLFDVFRGEAADPRTIYLHIDTDLGKLKAALYLSEVSHQTGPFSYVLGSNRAKMSVFERAMRIGSDVCGLDGTKASTRARFMSLPPHLRLKANFGNDLTDGSAQSNAVLEREKRLTTESGDIILFDNRGFHRGGIVEKGERIAIFMILG